MFLNQSKKITAAILTCLVAAASMFTVSCQKELSGGGFTITETPPDLTTKVSSSVSGFVTDENDAAVNGATVQVGASTTTTDKYGYFQVKNTDVVKTAAVVTVIQPGYFKGIKTYTAAAGKAAFFRIKLLPKTNSGNFDATAGGNVALSNGLSISFPAGAVMVAATSTPYTGQVNVAAQWISPTATDLDRIMPGDLRGLDSLGFIKLLTTYGMAAVELTGGSGELLQVATGKKATLTFPIPSAILAAAPANLPLWSFDEAKGLWKQEGNAVRSGSNYVGEVSHFSFWNCDVPNNYVQFNCTVLDADGHPLPYVWVRILDIGTQQAGYGYTDSTGYTSGAIPGNASLRLEVFTYYGCGGAVYTQDFTSGSSNVALGNITLPASSISAATVSGTATDCSSNPVTNGYIILRRDNLYYRYPISSTGTYEFSTILCSSAADVVLIAEDVTGGQQSTSFGYTIVPGDNVISNLQACGVVTTEFITYTLDGVTTSYTAPADSFYQYVNTQGLPAAIEISGQRFTGGNTSFTTIGFTESGIASGSTQQLTRFWPDQITDSLAILTPIDVSITEYGAVGQFIAGNFSGILTGRPPASTTYPVSCNFRIRRNY